MKRVIRTLIFHMTCIVIFSVIYSMFSDNFESNNSSQNKNNKLSFIDFVSLSTAIQASVGLSTITPILFPGKCLIILQQFMLICTHIITLYFFTL